jgi:hypothetical protein
MPKSDPQPQLTIISAQPGYRLLHDVDGVISVGDDVIAWQVESHWDQGEFHTMVEPVLIEGAFRSRQTNYLRPDGSVTFQQRRFDSVKEAQVDLTRRLSKRSPG